MSRPPQPASTSGPGFGAEGTETPWTRPDEDQRDRLLRTALLIREVDTRLLELCAEGALSGTIHTSLGQEFCAAAIGTHLAAGDTVLSNHRCHGHYLAATGDVSGLVAEVMGRQAGASGGRGGSQHLCAPGFLSTGVQGGCVPIAAGIALAARTEGRPEIAVCVIGDGSLGEGILYEVLNLASLWRLPVLFILENNGYAQSTPTSTTTAGTIAGRAAAFGVPHAGGDTAAWEHLWWLMGQAFQHVRDGRGPFLLEVRTQRLAAHSRGDDTRPPAEVATLWTNDPLRLLLDSADPAVLAMQAETTAQVAGAFARAAQSAPTRCPPAPPAHRTPAWRPVALPASPAPSPSGAGSRAKHVAAELHDFFDTLLQDGALLLGEDVEAPYGGAFKVTGTLSDHYPGRVLNTPISEATLVGVGIGLALSGVPALVEIMFGDFLTLAADQLVNHAAKLGFLKGDAGPDLVVRTPMGGGRGYGPTHSQTLESMFFGVPGLRVLAINHLVPVRHALSALHRGGFGPTLLVENKALYGTRIGEGTPTGFHVLVSDEDFPTAWLRTDRTPDVTLLGYGGMVPILAQACATLFRDHDVLAQALCPTQIHPLRITDHIDALASADALVIVEEGPRAAGFGAEVLAQLGESGECPRNVRRVSAAPTPIPAARTAEADVLPDVAAIVRAVMEVTGLADRDPHDPAQFQRPDGPRGPVAREER
ncbi:dehydrogenase E1 component subunit alpha/beta [Actinomadura monticuli]|uniref:dihydrolipoyllysine-residue succinyltransferase n=1 Tax=Actinomadura monticuli TaxID=3097367 RepID=A0ABV4Q4M6_9ACTN